VYSVQDPTQVDIEESEEDINFDGTQVPRVTPITKQSIASVKSQTENAKGATTLLGRRARPLS